MGPSIRLGKIFGIPIEVNFSWIFVFLLITYILGNLFDRDNPSWSREHTWALAVITAVLFFLSVLAHELSHSLVAVRRGIPVRGITLFFFGGISQLAHEASRPYTEFLVTIVGPVSSIILALVFWALQQSFLGETSQSLNVVFQVLWSINLMLGVVNMLPGFPLDGGRVLRAAIWGITGNYWRATQVAVRGGQTVGVLMVVGGGSLAAFDFSLFGRSGIWMALIGVFLFSAATATYRQEKAREGLKSYRVADVMTTALWTLPGETPVDSPLVGQALADHDNFITVTMNGRIEGLLTRRAVAQIPRRAWSYTPLSRVMLPLRSVPCLAPEDAVSDVLEQVESGRMDRLAVLSNGELLGFVSREDILMFARRVLRGK